MAVQTLVSREINPAHPSVITIGKVEAGSAGNVIAEEASLYGTIRTTNSAVRKHIIEGLQRIAKAVGDLHNASIVVEIREGYPPVVNTEKEAEIARRAVLAILGESGLAPMDQPSMGAEDFSYYLLEIPGCYVTMAYLRHLRIGKILAISLTAPERREFLITSEIFTGICVSNPI